MQYSETDPDFCKPFTVCDGGAGTSRRCPLWGRKDADGFGLELELRFQANAEDGQCSNNPNSSRTITFIMSKGTQPNPQRVYDNSSSRDGGGCDLIARWAGLLENPRPELTISREDTIYGRIAAVALVAVAGVAVLGVCALCASKDGLGDGPEGGSSQRRYADWAPSAGSRDDSTASLETRRRRTAIGSGYSEHLLSAKDRDAADSSVAGGVDYVSARGSVQ